MIDGYYYDQCDNCCGTGKDEREWGGRCIYCHGRGEVLLPDDDTFAEDDDEQAAREGR